MICDHRHVSVLRFGSQITMWHWQNGCCDLGRNGDGQIAEEWGWRASRDKTQTAFYSVALLPFTSLASCTVFNNQWLICFCFTRVCNAFVHLCVAHTLIAYQPQALLYWFIFVVGSSMFSVCAPMRTSQCLRSHSEKKVKHILIWIFGQRVYKYKPTLESETKAYPFIEQKETKILHVHIMATFVMSEGLLRKK